MTTLQLFNYGSQEVRTELIDGDPWFVAADVARILEYSATSAMTRRLDDEDKGVRVLHTLGGDQEMTIISEPGLFESILGSHLDGAKAFKRWITHEVLPAIRKTGHYGTPALDLNALDPRTLALAILEESDRADAAEKQLAIAAPKAEAFEKFMEADGSLPIGAVANMFKVGRQTLFDWLRDAKIIQGDLRPYQAYAHWFEVKASSGERNSGATWVSYTSKVLPSGVDPLFRLLVRRGYITPELAA